MQSRGLHETFGDASLNFRFNMSKLNLRDSANELPQRPLPRDDTNVGAFSFFQKRLFTLFIRAGRAHADLICLVLLLVSIFHFVSILTLFTKLQICYTFLMLHSNQNSPCRSSVTSSIQVQIYELSGKRKKKKTI